MFFHDFLADGQAEAGTSRAVGFGIATPQQAQEMAAVSDGAIVGSAIVKLIAQNGRNCIEPVCQYVREMKAAVVSASCV